MRIAHYAATAAMGFSVGLTLAPSAHQQTPDKLTAATLRNMLQGMGYEVKVLNAAEGKEKYEVPLKSTSLDIPVAFEISASTNYVWLTVFLGENKSTTKHEALLKENFNVQPTFFYITTKNNLMAAEAVDNRALTPVALKRCVDKLVADVDKTAKVWGGD